MLICKSCMEIFDKNNLINKGMCPKFTCHGELVEIDDVLLPVIRDMWKKGIVTKFCCSGHPTEFTSKGECYIVFDLNKSGIPIHNALKNVMVDDDDDDLEICVEYMPVMNSYTISVKYTNYSGWCKTLSLFSELNKEINMADVECSVYDENQINEYFFLEYHSRMADMAHASKMYIGVMVEDLYWRIGYRTLTATYGSLDEAGNEIPSESFIHNWDPDCSSFKRVKGEFHSMYNLKSILNIKNEA